MAAETESVSFDLSCEEYVAANKASLLNAYTRPSSPILIAGGVSIALFGIANVWAAYKGAPVDWLQAKYRLGGLRRDVCDKLLPGSSGWCQEKLRSPQAPA